MHWIVASVTIGLALLLVPGVEMTLLGASVTALILGFLNGAIKPILVAVTMPIHVLTLGLFSFMTNAILIVLTGAVVPGFSGVSIWWALIVSIALASLSMVFGLEESSRDERYTVFS